MKKKKDILSQVKSHTKVIATLITGYGVAEIMANVMKDYKPDAKGVKKILIKIGAVALTGMVVKEVSKFVEGEIDEVFDMAEEVNAKIKEEETNNDD